MRKTYGFSLIELMIVIAVICTLASIFMSNTRRAREKSALAACKSNVRMIGLAAELYFMDYKAYPVTPYDIIASHPFVVNGYLKTVPTCPNNTNPGGTSYFVNTSSGSNQTFHTGCDGSRHAALGIAPNNPRWDIEHGGVRETEWLP